MPEFAKGMGGGNAAPWGFGGGDGTPPEQGLRPVDTGRARQGKGEKQSFVPPDRIFCRKPLTK